MGVIFLKVNLMKTKLLLTPVLLVMSASVMGQNPSSPNSAQYHAIRNPNSPYSPYSNTRQQPSLPPVRWADRWGAIATDPDSASLGVAVDMPSKNEAESAALTECRANGGVKCGVDLSYHNQCAAMIVGDSELKFNGAATKEKAIELGMKACNSNDANCRVYYSGCSMPVQVQ